MVYNRRSGEIEELRMSSLLNLSSSRHTGPLKRPLRVLIVAKGKPRKYGDASKKLFNVRVCDSTMDVCAVCFDERNFSTLNEVLHNAVFKQGELVINSQTRLFKTSKVVPEDKRQEAQHIISPLYRPLSQIKDVAASPPKVRMTVRGVVTNVGLQTTANVNDRPSAVRQIEIRHGDDKLKVSPWRDHAGEDYALGQCIELTHVIRNARPYEGEIGLSTTQ